MNTGAVTESFLAICLAMLHLIVPKNPMFHLIVPKNPVFKMASLALFFDNLLGMIIHDEIIYCQNTLKVYETKSDLTAPLGPSKTGAT
jgi:hypothetical protein